MFNVCFCFFFFFFRSDCKNSWTLNRPHVQYTCYSGIFLHLVHNHKNILLILALSSFRHLLFSLNIYGKSERKKKKKKHLFIYRQQLWNMFSIYSFFRSITCFWVNIVYVFPIFFFFILFSFFRCHISFSLHCCSLVFSLCFHCNVNISSDLPFHHFKWQR